MTELSGLKASNEEISNANSTLKASATELTEQMKGLQNQISTLNSGKIIHIKYLDSVLVPITVINFEFNFKFLFVSNQPTMQKK